MFWSVANADSLQKAMSANIDKNRSMSSIKIIWKIEEVHDISWLTFKFIMLWVYMIDMVRYVFVCLLKLLSCQFWGKFFNVYVVYVNFINRFLSKFRIIDRLWTDSKQTKSKWHMTPNAQCGVCSVYNLHGFQK